MKNSIKKIFLLLKVNIRTMTIGESSNGKPKTVARKTLIIVGIALLAVYIVVAFSALAFIFTSSLYGALKAFDMAPVLLSLTSGVAGYVVLFFSLFYIITIFYYSKDIEMLLALPLSGSEILCSKFFTVLLFEYLTTIIAFIPFIYYGIMENCNILYYLYMIITVILLPIIPLCLGSILIMVVMKFAKFARNKDLFMVISSVFVMIVAFGTSFFFQKIGTENIDFTGMITDGQMTKIANSMFPGVTLSGSAMANSNNITGFLYLLAFVGICAVLFFITMLLGKKLYLNSAISINGTSKSNRKLNKKDLEIKKQPVFLRLIAKDFIVIFKTPAFLMNNILPILIFPAIFAFALFSGGNGIDLAQITTLISFANPESIKYLLFAGVGVGVLFSSFTSISATAISREGSSFVIMKIMPVPFSTQILSKCVVAMLMGEVGIVAFVLMFAAVSSITVPMVLLVILAATLSNMLVSMAFIFLDLRKPKLHWSTEQEAVKQSFNAFISMMIGLLAFGVCIVLAIFVHMPTIVLVPLVLIALVVLVIVMYVIVLKYSGRFMEALSY
ncbi:MAG: hypothetical protein RR088_02590 [Clostridia bacterium]